MKTPASSQSPVSATWRAALRRRVDEAAHDQRRDQLGRDAGDQEGGERRQPRAPAGADSAPARRRRSVGCRRSAANWRGWKCPSATRLDCGPLPAVFFYLQWLRPAGVGARPASASPVYHAEFRPSSAAALAAGGRAAATGRPTPWFLAAEPISSASSAFTGAAPVIRAAARSPVRVGEFQRSYGERTGHARGRQRQAQQLWSARCWATSAARSACRRCGSGSGSGSSMLWAARVRSTAAELAAKPGLRRALRARVGAGAGGQRLRRLRRRGRTASACRPSRRWSSR